MSTTTAGGSRFPTHHLRTLAAPILIVMILAMMVLPLPPFLLDFLFTFNINI